MKKHLAAEEIGRTTSVENVLARLNAVPEPERVETTLALREAPVTNTSCYDSLRDAAHGALEVDHA